MADNAIRSGIRVVSSLYGKTPPSVQIARINTAYQAAVNGGGNVDLNIGDPIRKLNTGFYVLAAGNEAAAGAAEDIAGIIVGIKQYYDGSKMRSGSYLPGGTVWGTNYDRVSEVYFVPVRGNIFEMDCDDAATATTEAAYQAFVGENVDHRLVYDAATRRANPRIDISTHVATTAQWNILSISKTAYNQDFSGNYVKLQVTITEEQGAI
jgi:hypothetical protein